MELHGVNEIVYTALSGLTLILMGVIAFFLKQLVEKIDDTSVKLTSLMAEHLRLEDRVDTNKESLELKAEHAREIMTGRMKNFEKSLELLKESMNHSFTMLSKQIEEMKNKNSTIQRRKPTTRK